MNLLEEKGAKKDKWDSEKPRVVSKKGRSMLNAKIQVSMDDFVECSLIFDLGNKNGEGSTTSSAYSLFKIIISYHNGFYLMESESQE